LNRKLISAASYFIFTGGLIKLQSQTLILTIRLFMLVSNLYYNILKRREDVVGFLTLSKKSETENEY